MYACMNAWIYAWMNACIACVYLNMKWRILKTTWTCFTHIFKLFQSRTRHVLTCLKHVFEHFSDVLEIDFSILHTASLCNCQSDSALSAFSYLSSSLVLFFVAVCSHLNLREFVSARFAYLAFARSFHFVKHASERYSYLANMQFY